jgi:hypothetical protein
LSSLDSSATSGPVSSSQLAVAVRTEVGQVVVDVAGKILWQSFHRAEKVAYALCRMVFERAIGQRYIRVQRRAYHGSACPLAATRSTIKLVEQRRWETD